MSGIHSRRPWLRKEFWDERYSSRNMGWDLDHVTPTLIELERFAEINPGDSVLVPGCGLGHDTLYFAKLGYKVSAVDWSKIAIDELRVAARRAQLAVELLCSDFWKIPKSWHGSFDAVVEHTFFSAIDPQDRKLYVEQILKLLKPKGIFIGAFFLSDNPHFKKMPESFERLLSSEGPPFFSTEGEVRRVFGKKFGLLKLEPSPDAVPSRANFEWAACFRRRK